jgi:hypothetical protein
VAGRADGSWIYEPNEVASIIRGGSISGPVTARAFPMFMAGKSDPEVVIDAQQRVRRIRELRGASGRPSPEGHFGAGAVEDAAQTAPARPALLPRLRARRGQWTQSC